MPALLAWEPTIDMWSKRSVRYIIVGGAAYIIEMVVLYWLHHMLGLRAVASVAVSYWVGFIVAFVLQKIVTFENREKRAHIIAQQVALYSLLVAWNYAFTLVLTHLLARHLTVYLIRTAVILITTCWNFLLYKEIFKTRQPDL